MLHFELGRLLEGGAYSDLNVKRCSVYQRAVLKAPCLLEEIRFLQKECKLTVMKYM